MKRLIRQLACLILAGGLLVFGVSPTWALSGNDQISLAGAGKFDQLASGIEAMVGREPMRAADWHALCFAYSRIKRYSRVLDCLDNFEKALAGRDKRSRLFGLDDATPTAYQMRAEALIELGQYPQALAQTDRILAWYKKEQSDDKDLLINALAARSLVSGLMGKRGDAEKYASELESLPLGLLGGDFVGAKSLALARVNMALGRWQKVLDALALDKSIGFDAPDEQPVSLLIFLLVPEASTQKHLEILSEIAELLSDSGLREKIKTCDDAVELHRIISTWNAVPL